ncbi:MAG: NAD(P)/FAD-dependent oxidoreductase, partial [candidate division Zixibacteria bacterium]|nr:NAD(P)/FAD-dependent oxidoreductase [candidate division Zixibacteria bacterium]
MHVSESLHRVIIIGGGFGGLYAAKALRKAPVEITLIDKRNFHLLQPLLYQVATGGLSPGDIAAPLRYILKHQRNVRVMLGEVTAIDIPRNLVSIAQLALPFDTLIVATGAENHYYGNDQWEQFAPGLKTIEDATSCRGRIFGAFELAERELDQARRQRLMTFVIVGGGPTGVELAGALAEIAHDTLKNEFRGINPAESQIYLVEASPRILSEFPSSLSTRATSTLDRLGVQVLTNHRVVGIDRHGADLIEGNAIRRIEAGTVLWGAGIRASSLGQLLTKDNPSVIDRTGRVKVERDLSLPGHPDIFVIGDLANFSHQTGSPLPPIAPVAMSQGKYVARLVNDRLHGRTTPPFHYMNKGILATIGRAAAVADFGWIRFSGFTAWVLWLFVHLMYLAGFENRFLVFIQWAWNYLTFNRTAWLITTARRKDQ